MIFAVTAPQFQAGASRSGNAPAGFDTGTVVVNALRADVKGLDGRDDQTGEQGGAVQRIELIQSARKSIIAQGCARSWFIIQRAEIQALDPLPQFIEGILGQGEIDREQNQQVGAWETLATRAGNIFQENVSQMHPRHDGSDKGQGSHLKACELSSGVS